MHWKILAFNIIHVIRKAREGTRPLFWIWIKVQFRATTLKPRLSDAFCFFKVMAKQILNGKALKLENYCGQMVSRVLKPTATKGFWKESSDAGTRRSILPKSLKSSLNRFQKISDSPVYSSKIWTSLWSKCRALRLTSLYSTTRYQQRRLKKI